MENILERFLRYVSEDTQSNEESASQPSTEKQWDLLKMLCKELKEYGEKGEMSTGTLDVVDKLAHTIKNLDKIIEGYEEEEGYSSRSYPDGMGGSYRGGSYRNIYRGSYARGRNTQRDSRGRYSSDNGYSRDADLVDQLHSMMQDAPNEQIRREMQRLAEKVEQNM